MYTRRQYRRFASAGCLAAGSLVAVLAAAADGPAFPVRPSDNGRYLVDAGGQPFFYHADTAWQIAKKLTREEVEFYLDDRKARGFTAIQVQCFSREQGPVANRAGEEPFQPADDILKPNEAYWRHLDFVLEAAEQRGFLVGLAAIWTRWGGGDREGWRYQLDEQNAPLYGQWLGGRYAKRQNLMWIVSGDSNPIDRTRAISLLAEAIKKAAPHHLLTAHNRPLYSSAAFFDATPWLDVNLAYTYEEVIPHVLGEWNRLGKTRPIILGESGYEEESNDGRGGDAWRVRRQAYQTILAGGLGGHCFGQKHIWRFDADWRAALDSPASRQMAHVKALFAPRPWFQLVPDQEHQLVTSGRELFGRLEYIAAARTRDGTLAILYFPNGGAATLDLGKLAGPVTARWFDPANGELLPAEGAPLANSGRRDFAAPGKNHDGGGDWVLVLEARGA
jgi:hypothetical protein